MPEDGDGGIDVRDVAEDAGPDAVLLVGADVRGEGGARVGAFVVVVACLLVHVHFGDCLQFGDGQTVEVVAGLSSHGGWVEKWRIK